MLTFVCTVWSRRVALALSRVDKTRAAITAARDGNVAAAKRTTAAAAVSAEAKVDKADAGHLWRNYQLDATVTRRASSLYQACAISVRGW